MRARVVALLAWAKRVMEHDAFATEQIYQAAIMLERTTALLERYGHELTGGVWVTIMTRLLRTARIGLYGEPLSGLQVMGLLEARGLDPRHVILLGVQEGKLPAPSLERSYIPFELRRAYGLPLRDNADAVQAYNFLRLIQRAEDVLLVHDAQNASGASRHIAQLRHELFSERAERMTFAQARVPVPQREATVQGVPHDAGTLEKVKVLLEQGISPTMLRTWLRCPLDLWFRYVCGLREPDVPGARIASDVLGNALHAFLEEVHRPYLDRPLDASELNAMIPGSGDSIRKGLLHDIPAERLAGGQPLLQLGMATRAAENFLREEARAVREGMRLVPRALEAGLRAPLPVAGLPSNIRAVVKGRLDRVDERDGVVHILDLKTGRVEESSLRIREISIDALKGEKGHAAQLLVYAWLYLTAHPEVRELRAGLQPLQRTSGSAGMYLRIGDRDLITRSDLPAITDLLTQVVRTLLDPATVFAHDPESAFCAFCATAG